jgi:hypothetical protein
MREYLSSVWCCFDDLVIAIAILIFMTESPIPITILRLFSCGLAHVLLFCRLKSVRIIINALSASISPVTNVFFIMIIMFVLVATLGLTEWTCLMQSRAR